MTPFYFYYKEMKIKIQRRFFTKNKRWILVKNHNTSVTKQQQSAAFLHPPTAPRTQRQTMTYKDIKHNEEVNELLKKGNQNLGLLGYTDHSQAHCTRVAETAAHILKKFGYPEHDIELVKIAGYMHDIGNSINRKNHAEYGALLANELLQRTDMSLEDRVTVVSAIANHDESTGGAVDIISAALIIADKTDVRRDRVREKDKAQYDIHDRVNYAVEASALKISTEKKQIALNLQIDESICTMYDYFDIFLGRMQMCRHAAEFFDARFKLTANGSKVL